MEEENLNSHEGEDQIHDVVAVSGMYESWFLDYASYVILERAVPAIEDGFKPVQRRILHAMKEMDDGRFNKVANIIGSTMQYHPHGDASIGDAIVNIGQKDLLIETQGNWGDIRTGDRAAAPRYIEARLSKFALEVVFNPQTTNWQLSYDGRKREPVTLPVKFPLLLAQGVEGIAVGLSTKLLPHNFRELIEASIAVLKGKKTNILPDFPTGGLADFSDYNEGKRGGKVRVRAKIEELDKKTLVIKDIPFGTTTTNLMDSIVKANDKGKIKVKKVVDNTAKDVEIEVHLAPGVSPDITIDALYAFTDCEVSISPNACVIVDDKPVFMSVNDILKVCTNQTVNLLKRELEIRRAELMEKMLFSSLEKIFIENRIYRDIEECETWEAVLDTIDKGLDPFKDQFYREIVQDDILKLTEIKIKRISKFDSFKADELMKKLQEELAEVNYNLENLVEYAIKYYQSLLDKYGKGRERLTEIAQFDTIAATVVAANNQKLYVNREDGFIGYGLKKDEYICECSDLDDIIAFRRDGKFSVVKIQDKVFVGKDILYAGVFKKNDERMVYNAVYVDGKSGRSMIKRFQVLGVTRDKEYDVSKGEKGSRVLYFSANPNGEAEIINISLTSGSKAKKKVFDFDFSELEIKGRGSQGNILTKYPVRKIVLKEAGRSTLGGLDIWYDATIGRLNTDDRGEYLGNFLADDKIIVFYQDGSYELTSFELTNRYDYHQILTLQKFNPKAVISAVYLDGKTKVHFGKRFLIETSTVEKKFVFISEEKGSRLLLVSSHPSPSFEVSYKKKGSKETDKEVIVFEEFIDIKGWKAVGNKLNFPDIKKLEWLANEDPEAEEKDGNDDDSGPDATEAGDDTASKATDDKQEIAKTVKKLKEEFSKETDENFDVGSSIDLDIKKPKSNGEDQLGLF
ncbi:DNA gyrase/topoisomerase IV subunit A [uncultured Imperialibacter sp.]|uniref:DNA gyrase/topoisomerase IV subunit A n=1 Tax=uncultured Imperialibacter sp. TaxID=1672639 RepID=UPI0030DCCA8F|tara:strand:+ start:61561 stop:64296 length:2736 start_codon:yes stop_codon:yes gene_type:complete